MRRTFALLLFLFIGLALLWSCQKEIVDSQITATPATGGTGGGTTTTPTAPGWSFTGPSSAAYRGCIDTAFYETIGAIKTLEIDGVDSAANEFSILLVSPTGTFAAATYTPLQGAQMVFTKASGQAYASTLPTSFSLQVTSISDTLITATFTAALTDALGTGSFAVANGKLRALIGKHNSCANTTAGGGSGGGGGSTNGVFSLTDAAGSCFNADLQGSYRKNTPLTAANKAILNVNVSATGPWSLSTATINGFKFSGSGSFGFTGPQTITLQAAGTPTAFGTSVFPLNSGSSSCSLPVPVDTLAAAPCSPTNNSVSFSTAGIGNFTVSNTTTTAGGSTYKIVGNGSGGDISLEFMGTAQPVAGVYRIQPTNNVAGDVVVSIVASSIFWQAAAGSVYVSVVNGKVVATFCSVSFSGSLGGPGFTTLATAKITER